MGAKSKHRKQRLEQIDAGVSFIRMFIDGGYHLDRHIRNKMKMRALGIAKAAFELHPELRDNYFPAQKLPIGTTKC